MSNLLKELLNDYWKNDNNISNSNDTLVNAPESANDIVDPDTAEYSTILGNTNSRVAKMYQDLGESYVNVGSDIVTSSKDVVSILYNNIAVALNDNITQVINTPVDLITKVGDAVTTGVGRVTTAIPGLLNTAEAKLLSNLIGDSIVGKVLEFPATLDDLSTKFTEELTWSVYSLFSSNAKKVPVGIGVSKPTVDGTKYPVVSTVKEYPVEPSVNRAKKLPDSGESHNQSELADRKLPHYMDSKTSIFVPGINPNTSASTTTNSINYPTTSAPFVGRDSLKDIELSTDFYWEVILSIPEENINYIPALPFSSWIPITSYDLQDVQVKTKDISTWNSSVVVPDELGLPSTITLTIVESLYDVVDHWRREYIACIFKMDSGGNIRILPYKRQMINITIYWMTPQLNSIRSRTFACIPDFGKLSYKGTNSKEAKTHSITFNIVGTDSFEPIPVKLSTGVKENTYYLF